VRAISPSDCACGQQNMSVRSGRGVAQGVSTPVLALQAATRVASPSVLRGNSSGAAGFGLCPHDEIETPKNCTDHLTELMRRAAGDSLAKQLGVYCLNKATGTAMTQSGSERP